MEKLIRVLEDLEKCTTTQKVDQLLNKNQVDKRFHFSEATYPQLPFQYLRAQRKGATDRGQPAPRGYYRVERLGEVALRTYLVKR